MSEDVITRARNTAPQGKKRRVRSRVFRGRLSSVSPLKTLFVCLLVLSGGGWCGTAAAGEGSIRISIFPPADIVAAVKFSEPSGNAVLDEGETGKLVITVKNTGRGPADNVRADISPVGNIAGLQYEKQISFGSIPAGRSSTREVPVKITGRSLPDEVKMAVRVRDSQGNEASPVQVSFSVKEAGPPRLIISDFGIYDQSCNLKIESEEKVELTARVRNIGQGVARNVKATVIPGKNVTLHPAGETMFELGDIEAGGYKDVKFSFTPGKGIKEGERIPLDMKVTEARPQYDFSKDFGLTLNSVQKSDRYLR